MTAAEVARALGLGRSTIYDLCNRGELRHRRHGSRVVIDPEHLAEYRARCERGPRAEARRPVEAFDWRASVEAAKALARGAQV